MELLNIFVVGIYVLTSNQNGQSAQDIPALWKRFFMENTIEKIPNKLDSDLYCVYTHYEGDYTQPYTTVLGCRVANLDQIPEGMIGIEIPKGKYKQFTARGDLQNGAVFQEWRKIWNTDLPRAYQADFEVYGIKAANPQDAEVPIYIGVK